MQRAEEREQSINLNLYWKGVNNDTVNITDDGRSNMPLSVLYTNHASLSYISCEELETIL